MFYKLDEVGNFLREICNRIPQLLEIAEFSEEGVRGFQVSPDVWQATLGLQVSNSLGIVSRLKESPSQCLRHSGVPEVS